MSDQVIIRTPTHVKTFRDLKAGEWVYLTGTIYTARDQAHKRLIEKIERGKRLSFDPKGKVLYYCGPTATPRGRVIGACGPTTSSRMDKFTPALLEKGLKAMIGKGRRSREVINAVKKHKAVYFVTIGGAAAYLSDRVKKRDAEAFTDLGPEAIYRLEVEDFPLIVSVDSMGNCIY